MAIIPYVLINSLSRSGGSLLARLFDGHPEVLSFPLEMWLGRDKWQVPTISARALAERDATAIIDETGIGNLTRKLAAGAARAKLRYDRHPFAVDPAEFERRLAGYLAEPPGLSCEIVFDAVARAFFATWLGMREFENRYWANHCSRLALSDPTELFRRFPSARVVQTIRDPRAFYVSSREREPDRGAGGDAFLRLSCLLWKQTTLNAIIGTRRFSDRYRIVRYEDLVTSPEATMRGVAEPLGLRYDVTLVEPTFLGKPWSGNSAFGAQRGLDRSRLAVWRELVSDRELEHIETDLGELMVAVGYRLHGAPQALGTASLRALESAVRETQRELGRLAPRYRAEPEGWRGLRDALDRLVGRMWPRATRGA